MKNLVADQLLNNPKISIAKTMILEALQEAQKEIAGVRPAQSDRIEVYDELLKRCAQARGGGLYYPYLGSGIGKGALVELADGSVKYDFISGIGPHYWGHSAPEMITASIEGALGDTVMQGNLQQNVDTLKLLETTVKLARLQGSAIEHCFLSTSGAMANENALKMFLQKHAPADRILCFEHCFSGRTLAMAQMTDKAAYRDGLPIALAVDYVPFYDAANPGESACKTIAAIEHHLKRFPGKYAAMCFELIQGEAGYYPGTHEFFKYVMNYLRSQGIGIWVDEIQTFGRTQKPFAFQHFELDEFVDVVTIGKLSQVCATLFTPDYKPRPGLLSQTFTAGSATIAAAQVVIDRFLKGDLFGKSGKIQQCHERFVSNVKQLQKKHPDKIKGPYGEGAMLGFTVFEGDASKSKAFAAKLFDAGVISFLAGANPTRIRFLMPVPVVKMEDIDAVIQIIDQVLASDEDS